jgi:acyl-CoA dehydrogenase
VDINQSARSAELGERVRQFMADHIYPSERRFYQEAERLGPWAVLPVVEELKPLAQAARLWNLFLPTTEPGGLGNLAPRAGSVQLQRARHRQHGDDPALRD